MRPKLTYANVTVTILAFIVLGGGAYAAVKLPKNTVGTKQLKKNAVTTAKIKNGAVTTAKLKNGAVNGAKVAADSLSGADINESSLGEVPSAQTAANAKALNGNTVRWLLVNPAGTIVSQSGGFTISDNSIAGQYIINVGATVDGHALIVSNGGAGDNTHRGAPLAGPCGTGADSSLDCSGLDPRFNDGKHIVVITTNPGDIALANHSFYLVMY